MEKIPGESIIISSSAHHMNTDKVARAIAGVLGARVIGPEEIESGDLRRYALTGFGSGIDSGKHYPPVLDLATSLPDMTGKKAFIFSTCSLTSGGTVPRNHAALRDILTSKGYDIVGEFGCRGFNTNGFLKYIGGINRGRPNDEDLQNAVSFAGMLANGFAGTISPESGKTG